MIKEKLNKIPVIALGTINGILLGVFLETLCRSVFLFEMYLRSRKPLSSGINISYVGYPFSWWCLPLLSIITVTLAAFIVHRYVASIVKYSIWFWQIVGIVAVLECAVLSIIFAVYNWYSIWIELIDLDSVITTVEGDLFVLFIGFPIIAVFNLLFALILKRLKTDLP